MFLPPLSYHSTSTGVAKNEVELFSAETIHNAFAPVNIHQFLDDTDSPGLFLRNLVIFDKTMVFRTNISNIRLTHQSCSILGLDRWRTLDCALWQTSHISLTYPEEHQQKELSAGYHQNNPKYQGSRNSSNIQIFFALEGRTVQTVTEG